ncbi:MAG: hypothetical protein IPG57_22170 [Burkholderiales bacterium]|jgi:hypothetical protein|nr:hypothetical protein [Burkholderiales bacterium]MBP7520341.1 hypothetical protein [Leptothrix sp. (in: b-proteobacteria)]HQY07431.1 hypothetical protein [Burkholderiaceae bacterium]
MKAYPHTRKNADPAPGDGSDLASSGGGGRPAVMRRLARSHGLLAATLIALWLAGCAAQRLPAPTPPQAVVASKVTVHSVLMSQDLRQLVVTTPRHHFVLEAPSGVAATLRSTYRASVVATFGRVSVDADGSCGLTYRLSLPPGRLSALQQAQALEDGYRPVSGGGGVLEGFLSGRRYLADVDLSDLSAIRLRQSYDLDVFELAVPADGGKGSASPSPIRRALKDALFIGTLPLFPLGIPMAILCADGSCTR